MRGIAARAGVDAALAHHYFGGKEKLFLAAMEIPFDPELIADQVGAGPVGELGERAARTFLGVWSDPVRRGPMLALLRSAMHHAAAARLLRQFVSRALLRRVMVAFEDLPDGALRAEAMVSHLVGLAIVRYVVKLEPLASTPDDELVALVGPVLQRYVDDAVSPTSSGPS